MIYSPMQTPPPQLLPELCAEVAKTLSIPNDHAWAFWHAMREGYFQRAGWSDTSGNNAPTVTVFCKIKYSLDQVADMLHTIQRCLSQATQCDPESIFVLVQRVAPYELMARGEIWTDG